MPPPLPVASKATKPASSTTNPDHHREATEEPKSTTLPRRSVPLIMTEKDWIHQEHTRMSIATRAIFRGLIVAMSLLLLSIVALRLRF
jgi:tetraacyldisaccharide-1-P 4'-kinase